MTTQHTTDRLGTIHLIARDINGVRGLCTEEFTDEQFATLLAGRDLPKGFVAYHVTEEDRADANEKWQALRRMGIWGNVFGHPLKAKDELDRAWRVDGAR